MIKTLLRNTKQTIIHKNQLRKFKIDNKDKEQFTCPICSYHGPFMDFERPAGIRKNAYTSCCSKTNSARLSTFK